MTDIPTGVLMLKHGSAGTWQVCEQVCPCHHMGVLEKGLGCQVAVLSQGTVQTGVPRPPHGVVGIHQAYKEMCPHCHIVALQQELCEQARLGCHMAALGQHGCEQVCRVALGQGLHVNKWAHTSIQ